MNRMASSARRLSVLALLPLLLPLQQTLKVDVNLVSVFVTAQDDAGNFVTDLDRENFVLLVDDRQQPIEVFEKQDEVDTSVGVLIDNSGSSADVLSSVKLGVEEFVGGLRADDETFVMSFAIEADVIHDFRHEREALSARLEGLRSWGTSVLYDALYKGIGKVRTGSHQRKALIVISDGNDNRSEYGYGAVVDEAQSSMALLYFIAIGPRVLIDMHTIQGLASMTGGSVTHIGKDDAVADALSGIRRELRNQYYLGYHAPAESGYHSIRVEVPGRDLKIRARDGYLVR